MLHKSKTKFNSILSTQTSAIEINTNYLAVAKIIANKLKAQGELTINCGEAKILTITNEYVDNVSNIAIIDRGRFKSILNKTLKDSINVTDIKRSNNILELFNIDIGEIDYSKDISNLIRLTIVLFFSGE